MGTRGKSEYSRVGVSVIIAELYDGNTSGGDIKVSSEIRVRDTEHAGEKGKTKALVRKESHALVRVRDDLISSVADAPVAKRLEKLVASLLYTLDARSVVLVLELLC